MSPLMSIGSSLSPAVHQYCHVCIIDLNVNILAIATVKHLYDFLYGCMCTTGYIQVHTRA